MNNPSRRKAKKSTIKTKNRVLAIPEAAEAIPPKPKSPATIAMIRKITAQRSIRLLQFV